MSVRGLYVKSFSSKDSIKQWIFLYHVGYCAERYYCPDYAEIDSAQPSAFLCPAGFYCPAATADPVACPPGNT